MRIALSIGGLCGLLVIASFAIAPSIYLHDFGEWLYQAAILAQKVTDPQSVEQFSLYHYPVPNSLALYVMAAMHVVLPPILVGKLYLAIHIVAWFWVAAAFVKRYFSDPRQAGFAWVLIVCLAAFSSFFWYGFVSYQTGLLLFLWFLTVYDHHSPAWIIAVFGILLFLSHAAIFLQFGLLIVLGVLVARYPPRQFVGLVPAAALALAFVAGRFFAEAVTPVAQASWSGWLEAALYKAGMVVMQGPFKNFILVDGTALLEHYPWLYWTGVTVNGLVVAALGLITLGVLLHGQGSNYTLGHKKRNTAVFYYFAVLLVVIYLVAPHNFFGLIHPGGRVVLPLLFVTLALLPDSGQRLPQGLVMIVAVTTLATAGCYYAAATSTRPIASSVVEPEIQSSAELTGSVFDYNEWLYRNTRYSYFNYRIFVLSDRYRQLREQDYRGVSFVTGPISQYREKPLSEPIRP
ncbi:MAG: hypothetical protein HOC23_12815 [Halieaceae bacterium]|jgi:hypothetical protein|nr:hypothetical protein [Halieaceae bacterium]